MTKTSLKLHRRHEKRQICVNVIGTVWMLFTAYWAGHVSVTCRRYVWGYLETEFVHYRPEKCPKLDRCGTLFFKKNTFTDPYQKYLVLLCVYVKLTDISSDSFHTLKNILHQLDWSPHCVWMGWRCCVLQSYHRTSEGEGDVLWDSTCRLWLSTRRWGKDSDPALCQRPRLPHSPMSLTTPTYAK